MPNKKTIIKYLWLCAWFILGGSILGLLAAAVVQKDSAFCRGLDISIHGFNNNFFIDKKDIENTIVAQTGSRPEQKRIGSFELRKLEKELEKNIWIKKANLFFDNTGILHIKIEEREPVARVFTATGTSFYIDTALMKLPVTENKAANVQVFTNFPAGNQEMPASGSALLADVKNLGMALQKDSFFMVMIDQVYITPRGTFEMVPKLGSHIITFGDAADMENKFEKLRLFYKNVFPKTGINYYASVNVQYNGQIVARKRGTADVTSDSIRSARIMQVIADNAKKASSDTLDILPADVNGTVADTGLIRQSTERDEEESANSVPAETIPSPTAPAAGATPLQTNNRRVQQRRETVNNPKPPPKPPARAAPPKPNRQTQPRAVMPRRNN